ncbi:phasin family protein [Tepidimonas ignava]|uniref:phasin family protein n=1 Tax=Tepidimonas ignava TaxID=114249 RepID=UPI002FDAB4A6
MLTPEQLAAAHKANLEMLVGLTRQAFEGVEKLVELNLEATRAALRDVAGTTQAMLDAKDAQELLQRQAALLQPLAERTLAYSRQLADIAAHTGGVFAQAAQAQAAEAQHKAQAVVDNVARNAPAGTEPAVQALRAMVNAAATAMETVQQAVKQATELTQQNWQRAAEQTQQAVQQATTAVGGGAAGGRGGRRSA